MDKAEIEALLARIDVWLLVFGIIVVVGVAGESFFGIRHWWNSRKLQTIQRAEERTHEEEIARLNKEAGEARKTAGEAHERAATAEQHAAEASAKAEAFRLDIAKANESAARAQAQVAGATADAAKANLELAKLKTPRSLINVPELIAELQAFKGTEYTLCVFQDDESIQFTKAVDDVLHGAGWNRKPVPYRLGITSIMIFGKDREQAIPVCIETGVQVHVRSKESLDVLNTRPLKDQSRSIQTAYTLLTVLRSHIVPPNDNNAADKVSLDDEPGEEFPIRISIGKKP